MKAVLKTITILLAGGAVFAQSLESSGDGPFIGEFTSSFKTAKVYTIDEEGVQRPGYSILKYKQQPSGNKLYIEVHGSDEEVISNTIITQNGDRPYFYQIIINPDATEHTSHYTFNPDGSPLNQKVIDRNGEHLKTITYKYDTNGSLGFERVYNDVGELIIAYQYVYHHDKDEQLLLNKKDEVLRSRIYTYNERGYPATMTIYIPAKDKTTFYRYEYEYDEEFNYTSVKTYKDDIYQSTIIREIEY